MNINTQNAYLKYLSAFQKKSISNLKCISLFSGGGGLDLGANLAGFESLLVSDIMPRYTETIKHNLPGVNVFNGDAMELTPELLRELSGLGENDLDLIIAGPPCQSFSIIGKRRAMDDPRGKLTIKYKVFEMFILNFYSLHLDKETYRVHAPKINWHITENATDIWGGAFDVDVDPGDRRTDIVVENKALNLQMIFDAKYYKKTFVEAYMNPDEQRTRTGHLNQVRGYLIDSEFAGAKVGALLYPMVNDDLKRGTVHPIEGTPIIIKTINLNAEWRDIEEDMLDFLHRVEIPYRT